MALDFHENREAWYVLDGGIARLKQTTALNVVKKKREENWDLRAHLFLDSGSRESHWNLVESNLQKLETIVVVVPEVLPQCIVEQAISYGVVNTIVSYVDIYGCQFKSLIVELWRTILGSYKMHCLKRVPCSLILIEKARGHPCLTVWFA